MIRLFTILAFLMFLCLPLQAQKQIRGVWGAGGTTAFSGKSIIYGTLSQTAIGRSAFNSNEVHSGFWYTLYGMLPKYDAALIVVIPVFSGKVGQTIDMPIYLDSATNLPLGGNWHFSGSFTFNATVLEPIAGYDSIARDKNGLGRIVFSGIASDSSKILKKITYKVKLGNAAVSPLTWEQFAIKEFPKATIIKKNGEFQLEDLCYADGKPRLIEAMKNGLALSAFPLPATSTLTVTTQTIEQGITELYLVGNDGKIINTVYSGKLKPGFHEIVLDTEFIPSGSYFLVMKTPSDLLTTRCVIAK